MTRLLALALAVAVWCSEAAADPITVTTVAPDSVEGIPVSPAFGPVAAGGLVTDQYVRFGLVFTGPTAIFDDPPLAWGGVNSDGVVDLVSPVSGAFVVPGSRTPGRTGFLSVELGLAEEGSLLLEVFDVRGRLLGSVRNDLPLGPHGRTTATIEMPAMASFRVSGPDTWGIDQIQFGEVAPVPEPSTVALVLTAAAGMAIRGRRRTGAERRNTPAFQVTSSANHP